MNLKIYKILSKNDTGETKSHQSGITIPKIVAKSGIFPELSSEILNHRKEVVFFDEEGVAWNFQYIYYNDVFFGKPRNKAHNEFRLTCVREYIKKYDIKSGDQIWFSIDKNGIRHIGYIDKNKKDNIKENSVTVIKLKPGWHSIEF